MNYNTLQSVVRYETKNQALTAIFDGMKAGQFKDCKHLKFDEQLGAFNIIRQYTVVCIEDSFEEPGNLEYHGQQACPEHCLFFQDRNEAFKARLNEEGFQIVRSGVIGFWKGIAWLIAVPFRWFASLSGIAQGTIILLAVIYYSPRLAEAIIKIIHALK